MDEQRYLTCPPDRAEQDEVNPFLNVPEYRHSQVTFKTFTSDEIRSQAGKEVLPKEAEWEGDRDMSRLKIEDDDRGGILDRARSNVTNPGRAGRQPGRVLVRGSGSRSTQDENQAVELPQESELEDEDREVMELEDEDLDVKPQQQADSEDEDQWIGPWEPTPGRDRSESDRRPLLQTVGKGGRSTGTVSRRFHGGSRTTSQDAEWQIRTSLQHVKRHSSLRTSQDSNRSLPQNPRPSDSAAPPQVHQTGVSFLIEPPPPEQPTRRYSTDTDNQLTTENPGVGSDRLPADREGEEGNTDEAISARRPPKPSTSSGGISLGRSLASGKSGTPPEHKKTLKRARASSTLAPLKPDHPSEPPCSDVLPNQGSSSHPSEVQGSNTQMKSPPRKRGRVRQNQGKRVG